MENLNLTKNNTNKIKTIILYIFPFLFLHSVWAYSPLDQIPIQDRGRVKPFKSFAQETLYLIHGSKKLKIQDTKNPSKKVKREASEVILTFMLAPDQWETTPIIRLDHLELKKALGFKAEDKFFSMQDFFNTTTLGPLMQQMSTKVQRKEKLNPFDQAVQKLESQLGYMRLLQSGDALRLVPSKKESTWLSVNQIEGPVKDQFAEVLKSLIQVISNKMNSIQSDSKANQDESKNSKSEIENLNQQVLAFIELAKNENPESYVQQNIIQTELHYSSLQPFFWSSISYFFAFLSLMLFWVLKKHFLVYSGWIFTFLGLGFHIYGFVLRSIISGRAPVTNMYETVVWVPLGAIVFGIGIEYFKKDRFTLLAANLGAFLCLLLADMAPAVLDPTIQPLEAVLRSNFWLSTHVTTIVISYAAFFLAFVLGDINLIYFAMDPAKWGKNIKSINDSIYRAIQIGILLLGIGIVLGGIWADYSWGRFWGWDPKETWALIALLGYLAVLHARLVGWVKQFGMSAAAVASFSLVIMAWYGVNYVLGAGLHSYGFGAGGVEYVTAFVVLHFLFIFIVWLIKERKLNSRKTV